MFRGGYRFRRFEGVSEPKVYELPLPERVSIPLGAGVSVARNGDAVRAGEALVTGADGVWTLPAPIGGTVELKGDGFARIRGDRSAEFEPVMGHTREPWRLEREELRELARKTGTALLLGNPASFDAVTCIVVNAVHTSPVSRRWSPELYGDRELAGQGFAIVRALFPNADIILAATRRHAGIVPEDARGFVVTKILSDKFPQEHPALLARDAGHGSFDTPPLIVDYTDIVQLAETLTRGRPLIDRIVCIGGPGISRPGWYRVRIGTPAGEILRQTAKDQSFGPWRAVAGNPLSGRAIEADEALLFRELELSVVSDRAQRELLSFLAPGFAADSYARATVSSVLPLIPRKLETAVHGGERPCVQCNFCDEVCPQGLYPFLIWKFSSIGKPEDAARLRPEKCIDCGLCDYVCPSKIPVLDGVRKAREALSKKDGT